MIAGDPRLQQRLTESGLDAALEAIADFTDLRLVTVRPFPRPADLAAHAGELCGLPVDDVVILRRATLVHDVGMHGVPATILEKPGPLTSTESERMRMHAYYTERTLARPPGPGPHRRGGVARERALDGSGYHRGLSGSAIPAAGTDPGCRVRVPGDDRASHLPPCPYAEGGGRGAPKRGPFGSPHRLDAVDAVLAAAGQQRPKRAAGPAGLTPREVEVLTLIARGASNKQVARALGITPAAGTHIERIYSKIGASTRSTATLFAMQNGFLDSFAPLDL